MGCPDTRSDGDPTGGRSVQTGVIMRPRARTRDRGARWSPAGEVRRHRSRPHSPSASAPLPPGVLRLGLEADLLRDLGPGPAHRVVAPGLGQVPAPVQEHVPARGGVGQGTPSGTPRKPPIRQFSTLPAVPQSYPCTPTQATPFFRGSPSRGPLGSRSRPGHQSLPGHRRSRTRRPGGGPGRHRHPSRPDRLGHLPAVLALDRGEQAPQVLGHLLAGFPPSEPVGEARVEGEECLAPALQVVERGHRPLSRRRCARPAGAAGLSKYGSNTEWSSLMTNLTPLRPRATNPRRKVVPSSA